MVSLARTYDKSRALLKTLSSQSRLDQLSLAAFIDFSLCNPNVNLFIAVMLSFEMTLIGSIIQDYQIKIFRLYDRIDDYDILVYLSEFLFVTFTIYSLTHEILLIFKEKKGIF